MVSVSDLNTEGPGSIRIPVGVGKFSDSICKYPLMSCSFVEIMPLFVSVCIN